MQDAYSTSLRHSQFSSLSRYRLGHRLGTSEIACFYQGGNESREGQVAPKAEQKSKTRIVFYFRISASVLFCWLTKMPFTRRNCPVGKGVKMPIEANLSTPASNGMGHGAQHEDSPCDESSALLPNSPISPASVPTEATGAPPPLPPGFIWIETGTYCPHVSYPRINATVS
jgi:hypothetical protein